MASHKKDKNKNDEGFSPIITASLIKGGFDLVGGGITGIGAALTAGKREETRRREREEDIEFREKEFALGKQETRRAQNLQGIQLLAATRQSAEADTRRRSFRDAVLGG